MGFAEVASPTDRSISRPARPVWGPVAAGVAMAVLGVLGGSLWWASRPPTVAEARVAAERGREYLRRGRPDLAFEAVNRVRDESPEAGEAMAVAGLALARMGQYRVARLALERALRLKPDQFEAAVALGELDLDLGNARRGAEVLEQATRLRPRAFGVWRTLGRALDDLNDTAGAARAYEKALALRPDDRDVLIEWIALLMRHGQSAPARPLIDRALRESPDDPAVLGLAARAASGAGRVEEALALADRALRRDPRNPDALLARAHGLVVRSRWEDALEAAGRAATESPNDSEALQLLWIAQSRLGRTGPAAATRARREQVQARARRMDELIEQLQEHPDDPAIPWKMGQAAVEAGSYLFADRCFGAALAIDPDYRPAREGLAALRASHPELARTSGAAGQPGSWIPRPRSSGRVH